MSAVRGSRFSGTLPAGVDGPASLAAALRGALYLADDALATVLYVALDLARPILLEGEAGVGKTEVAKALAQLYGTDLIRLQCYEGLDVSQAVYEWSYPRQILHIRTLEAAGAVADAEADIFSEDYLVRRPLLEALAGGDRRRVLLIDEVDRADDEFEAYLLEILADYSVTVPEIGTFRAADPPVVVITSNRTRELHDALKRRCLYHWVDHPSFEREVAVVSLRLPDVSDRLVRQVTALVQSLRDIDLYKPPGVAETIDWVEALHALGCEELDGTLIDATLGSILKYREDLQRARGAPLPSLLAEAVRRAG